ncbi:U3 small nucleolar ribonucleoprotein protein IMP3-like [Artemia franciscana]|uniref:U3 small nucleolar ribonucleoprotein protein IMP3 n=1 Tax=Artemia franciscana TaxID=6661 RepID=A0AA88HBG0_ARTSF|nr:hypothetical protein QYM36_015080 [Artemia franciscana]CAG4635632.1 EOG090X0APJ [Artemia franciscana]
MVRKLKFSEQKLLKNCDFLSWKIDDNNHEYKVLRRYHIQKKEDYTQYNKLSREVRQLAEEIKKLDPKDKFRSESSAQLLEKLYQLGLIPTKWDLSLSDKITASSFCRRRLPVVITRLKMVDSIKTATTMVEQGHIRVGPEVIKDPAFLVTRNLEDFVTWVDSSKIKQKVMEYNEERDDFLL